MLRCKLNGILALCLLSLLEHISYSREDKSVSRQEFLLQPPQLSPAVSEAEPLTLEVSASVYFPEAGQTDSTPLITADGSKINERNPRRHRWVAVSRNLLKRWGGKINYGDSLLVKGISAELDGIYVVRDSMNRRIRNRIDILVGRKDKIVGKWDDVQITRLNRPAKERQQQMYTASAGAMVAN